jgi:1-acyl-sn-glycerol-3-phosphate acyltransferase
MTLAATLLQRGLAFWRRQVDLPRFPSEDFFLGLADKYLEGVEVVDPASFTAVAGQPVLFLANHQVFVESLLFCTVVAPLHERPIVGLAKSHHVERWVGRFVALAWAHPSLDRRSHIEYVDRDRPEVHDLKHRLAALVASGVSLLVHVEGTRRRSAARGRVQAMQPFWTDLAVAQGLAVVPVRFVGGLPVEDLGVKQEVPVGHGRQIIRLGPAIAAGELAALAPGARLSRVRAAINDLSDNRTEQPGAPDPEFSAAVDRWVARSGGDVPTTAILMAFLRRVRALRPEIETLATHGVRSFADPLDAFAAACFVTAKGGRPVLELADGPEGRWLAALGGFLVGPRGLEIVLGAANTVHDEAAARMIG